MHNYHKIVSPWKRTDPKSKTVNNEGFTVELDVFDPSEGDGGSFYIKGECARGIQVFYEDDSIVVKINSLSNYADYIMAKVILSILENALEKEIIDEKDNDILADEYFTDVKIQKLREDDAKTVLVALKNEVKDNLQIFGTIRKVYFGHRITQELLKYEDNPRILISFFDSIIHHVQYELPEYNMPGATLIPPKDSEDENDFIKIRMMFEGNPYILQDYDYLMLCANENKDDNEGTDFYYIGKMKTDYESKEQTQIPNEKGQMLPVVNFQFDIEPSVPQNIYNYLEAKHETNHRQRSRHPPHKSRYPQKRNLRHPTRLRRLQGWLGNSWRKARSGRVSRRMHCPRNPGRAGNSGSGRKDSWRG